MSVRRRSIQALVVTVLVAQFAACGSDGPTGTTPVSVASVVATVQVTSAGPPFLVSLGETLQLTASARDANGHAFPGKTFTFAWSSSDESIATVSSTGLATAIAYGAATITATTEDVQGSASLTVSRAFAYVAYVANFGAGSVSVLSAATNTVVATVRVGAGPRGVAITPDGAFAYVTNRGFTDVSVFATASNTVVATVPVGVGPSGVAIMPDGAFAYVTNIDADSVSVLSTASYTVVATVPVGTHPRGVAITPDGAFAYVTNRGSADVSVLATASNTVVATVPVGRHPLGVAITPFP